MDLKKKSQTMDMTKGSPTSLLLRFAMPLFLGHRKRVAFGWESFQHGVGVTETGGFRKNDGKQTKKRRKLAKSEERHKKQRLFLKNA